MAKILGIGNAVLDTLFTVNHYPDENEELRASQKQQLVGGNINNSLYVLSQLGHQCAICTSVAADQEAKQLIAGIKERKIDTTHVQTFIKGRTPNSFITLNSQNGSRTIVHYRDLPEISFDFFAKIEIEDYDWLHFEGRNMQHLPGMLNIAKTFLDEQPISLEIEKPREGIEALFPQANLLIFSHHYGTAKGFNDGETLLKSMQELAPHSNLVCTWGEKGAWFCSPGGEIKHQVAESIDHIVDTLGAGDTFNAGLIHSLNESKDLQQAVAFASQLAAKKIRQNGLDDLLTEKNSDHPLANIKQVTNAKTTVVESLDGTSVVLIKFEGKIKAYENNCPHQNVPLNEAYKIDVNPFDNTMKCSVHDAFFNIEDGLCVEGPCWNESLKSLSIRVDDKGDIYLLSE
ncbi:MULTISPECIES: PfkB family carbohydrate kinase [Thiomicrorhabdus]|uniref:Rieske 2Fe-2S domain-containing protein n=1 Tax=Thiomicrorhabdus heinhorstiae TaxID=2748010 RepID=A0ABS0C074_9GAMM|nr:MULTISPECIES: PfkB family carbohydrate kinase [Thiomicrorhabdus]MBF6058733.1 Rieske 2Fe-2S domain-containing protein [Thiomicrorhabdus heinhorstiae]